MTESPAISHSLNRLAKARSALARLECAETLDEAENAWSDLLLAGNGVYSKLEQGCKLSGKAMAWFGRVKKKRKDDPLLSYMHHARNSEEHTIEDITKKMKAGSATITIREPYDPKKLEGLKLVIGKDSLGNPHVSSSDESVIMTKNFTKASLVLVRVNDPRFSDFFDPPFEHLGQALPDQSPQTVGRFFVGYLSALIEEARKIGV